MGFERVLANSLAEWSNIGVIISLDRRSNGTRELLSESLEYFPRLNLGDMYLVYLIRYYVKKRQKQHVGEPLLASQFI